MSLKIRIAFVVWFFEGFPYALGDRCFASMLVADMQALLESVRCCFDTSMFLRSRKIVWLEIFGDKSVRSTNLQMLTSPRETRIHYGRLHDRSTIQVSSVLELLRNDCWKNSRLPVSILVLLAEDPFVSDWTGFWIANRAHFHLQGYRMHLQTIFNERLIETFQLSLAWWSKFVLLLDTIIIDEINLHSDR